MERQCAEAIDALLHCIVEIAASEGACRRAQSAQHVDGHREVG
jgi:hypothetical protein